MNGQRETAGRDILVESRNGIFINRDVCGSCQCIAAAAVRGSEFYGINAGGQKTDDRILQNGSVAVPEVPAPGSRGIGGKILEVHHQWRAA